MYLVFIDFIKNGQGVMKWIRSKSKKYPYLLARVPSTYRG